MNNLIETVGKAMQPVRKVKTVDDVLAPYQKVITDLVAVKAEREELITKAHIRLGELAAQIEATEQAIRMHKIECEDADRLIASFSELLA